MAAKAHDDDSDNFEEIIRAEFKSWCSSNPNLSSIINLKSAQQDDDGVKNVEFLIDSKQSFILRCPQDYPKYQDDNFFVEASSSLQLWSNALNEFLLDSSDNLHIGAILSKACSLYSYDDSMDFDDNSDEEDIDIDEEEEEEEGEENAQEDYHLDDLLDQDLNWELEVARRKKRWKLKEEELRNAADNKDSSGSSTLHPDQNLKSRQPKQIFTSAGASGILINDLVSIMESVKDTQIVADSIDDNIFQWNVKISNFDADTPLHEECEELMKKYNYDYIELQIEFSMDLYPFFPPLVKVIRPRLQGGMMLRVTTMEILKLTYWSPARDMKSVLMDIKMFLANRARLDLNSERNDRERYPDGAYIDIEHHLLRLALVSEVTPRVNKKYSFDDVPQIVKVMTVVPGPCDTPDMEVESSDNDDNDDNEDDPMASEDEIKKCEQNEQQKLLVMKVNQELDMKIAAATGGAEASSSEKNVEKGIVNLVQDASGAIKSVENSQDSSSIKSVKSSIKLMKKLCKMKKKGSEDSNRKTIAKGTGYSNWNHQGWDVKAYMAAQNEKDRQIWMVLALIMEELKKFRRISAVSTRNLPDLLFEAAGGPGGAVSELASVETVNEERDLEDIRGCKRKRKHSPEASPVDPISDLYAVLEGSALVPFLESRLQNNSFLEICRHIQVFKPIIGILREMAEQSCLVSLLGPLPDQTTSLHTLLLNLEAQARIVNEKVGKASANGSVPSKSKEPGTSSASSSSHNEAKIEMDYDPFHGIEPEPSKHSGEKSKNRVHDDTQGLVIAREFLSLSKQVTEALNVTGILPDINGITATAASRTATPSPVSGSPEPGPSSASIEVLDDVVENDEVKYVRIMGPLQYDSVEFASMGHAHINEFNSAAKPSSQTIFRIAQEISSLAASSSLPCSLSSSVFVRSDDSKMTLLKAIITGPSETPYTGGVFEFDIFFPPGYPRCPPKVTFRTTGAGNVRFNPNLYMEGKVCLSLLGTWGGAKGEEWNADTSTIIQVLVSIQSLILVPEPYFNEPGYDRTYGTAVGNRESLQYNENVFKNNLRHAILGQIRKPPEGFQEVVRSHFFFKRDTLIRELETQAETYKSKDLQKLLAEVKTELYKLEKPNRS